MIGKEFNFINPWQLEKLAIYKGDRTYIVDPGTAELQLEETNSQRIVNSQQIQARNHFNICEYASEGYIKFHHLHLCRGRLFALIHNVLYEVDLNRVVQVARFPEPNISKGFARLAVHGQSLLLTDDERFYTFDPETRELKQVSLECPDGSPMKIQDNCGLYSLDSKRTIVQFVDQNDTCKLYELPGGSLRASRLLDISTQYGEMVYAAEGIVAIKKVDSERFQECLEVFDLTAEVIEGEYRAVQESLEEGLRFGTWHTICRERALVQMLGGEEEYKAYQARLAEKLEALKEAHSASVLKRDFQFYQPTVQLAQYQLFNQYQLSGKILCYNLRAMEMDIVELNSQIVLQTIPIETDLPMEQISIQSQNYIDPLILFNGRLFGYLDTFLFEVKLNKLVALHNQNVSSGFSRICILNGQLFIHDEINYYNVLLKGNSVELVKHEEYGVFEQIGVYSFCNAMIAKEQSGSGVQIVDKSTGKILALDRALPTIAVASGLFVCSISEECIAVDLTAMKVYYIAAERKEGLFECMQLAANGLINFSDQAMLNIFQTPKNMMAFEKRRDAMYDAYMAEQQSAAPFDMTASIYKLNEFGVPCFEAFFDRAYADLFERSNTERGDLKQRSSVQYHEQPEVSEDEKQEIPNAMLDQFMLGAAQDDRIAEVMRIINGRNDNIFG